MDVACVDVAVRVPTVVLVHEPPLYLFMIKLAGVVEASISPEPGVGPTKLKVAEYPGVAGSIPELLRVQ